MRNIKKLIIVLIIIVASISITRYVIFRVNWHPRNVIDAHAIEIEYIRPFNGNDYSIERLDTKISAIVNDAKDERDMLQIISRMQDSNGGDCGYSDLRVLIYKAEKVYEYYIGSDSCSSVKDKYYYYEIKHEDEALFKSLINKYLPDRDFMPWLEEWSKGFR